MKKLILTILLSLFMIETLHANKNFDVSLDIARVKKIDDVIKRVNSINSYINQYILDTADTTPTKKELVNHFGISLDLFKDYTYESDFDISLKDNKKVIYTSVVPDSLTPQQIKFYKHSKSLHPQAVVKDDLSIEITLDAKTQFLLSSINSLPSDSIVSNTEPTDTTKKWYKPDGLGGWSIYAYNSISSSWEILDNSKSKSSQASTQKTTILDSKEELNSLQALEGDIAYVKSDNNTSTDKYVYSGSRWLLESSASMVGKNSCSAEQLGVISYSQKNDCMQRCKKVADDKYTWECIKDSKEPKIYRTCYEIKQANPDAKDGVYTIDPDGKGEGEGGVEYFIYKHSQEQTNGAKSNIQVTGIYKKNSVSNILNSIQDKLYTKSNYYLFSHPSLGYSGYNYMGGNNWFKKHNIKIENFKGGFITFADGTIGIIDIMSNGYGRSESAYVYYKTYKNTKFEKHINDIKPFKVYCDMTTDGGGWTAIKYTYDLSQKPVASKEHLTKNYYLDRDTVLKLLDLSSTFLFREDDSNTLAKLKPEAYPYIKSNIEGKHGWFMDTYGNDDLTAWMTPIDGKNIPDAKMKGCDNFRGKSYDYMYKYVLDSCNNYYGSHFNLYDFHRMRGGAYYTKRKNFLYIGGSKSTTTIPQATVKTTTDTKSRQRYYYCPSGYYQTSNNCYKYTYSCPSGYTPDGNRCSKKVVSCPSGYNHSHIYAACYGVGSNYNEYTRPASGACRSGYRPGGAYRNGRYIHCVRYIPEIIKKAYTSKVRSKTTTGLRSYYGCPSGYSASGSQCVKTITTHTCPTGYKYSGSRCVLK